MVALPFIVPRTESIARAVVAHSQTAQAEDAWWGDYQMGYEPDQTYTTSDILDGMSGGGGDSYVNQYYPGYGDTIDNENTQYSNERTPASQEYVDRFGVGGAPCIELGNCNDVSLKDTPTYDDTSWYTGSSNTGGSDWYSYESWDEYYAPSTAYYVGSGLSQIPSILSNVTFPQSQQQTIYTTSYVPQQTYTYTQPTQTYTQSAQTYTFAQPQTSYTQSASYAAPQASFVPVAQQVSQASYAPVQQGSYSSPISHQMQYQTAVATPVATPSSGYAVATLQPTVVARSQPIAVSGTVVSAPALPQPTCTLSVSPTKIPLGTTTVIAWTSSRGEARMDPWGLLDVKGARVVTPTTTTTYLLTVNGDNDTKATCRATVTVDATMCANVCPPGYTCTLGASNTKSTSSSSGGFWSWLGF